MSQSDAKAPRANPETLLDLQAAYAERPEGMVSIHRHVILDIIHDALKAREATANVETYRNTVLAWLRAKEAKWRETAQLGLGRADECAGFYAAAYHNAADGIARGEPERKAEAGLIEAIATMQPGWRPIATAPLDFLGPPRLIAALSVVGELKAGTFVALWDGRSWREIRTGIALKRPTHWQPLPEPPVTTEASDG